MSFLTTVAPAVKVENENPKGLMAGLGAKQIAKNMQSNAFLSGTKRCYHHFFVLLFLIFVFKNIFFLKVMLKSGLHTASC